MGTTSKNVFTAELSCSRHWKELLCRCHLHWAPTHRWQLCRVLQVQQRKQPSTLGRPAPDSRAGFGYKDLMSHLRTKTCPWCATAESVYKVLPRGTLPLAKTVACRGSTSTYTVCILATVTSKGRNTTGVCLVANRALPPGTRSTARPWAWR